MPVLVDVDIKRRHATEHGHKSVTQRQNQVLLEQIWNNTDLSHFSDSSRCIAIFVDGCFWHGCGRCYMQPKTNSAFWKRKIDRNRKRRLLVRDVLKKERFRVLEFWEHEVIQSPERVIAKIDKVWDRNRSRST
jgi:DNA mismatch endonuclease Vsr